MSKVDTGKPCLNVGQTTNTAGRLAGCRHSECSGYAAIGCICRIRELNDNLRTQMNGGLIHMTDGVAALGLPRVNAIFQTVAAFTAFTDDNDPWGEHDCATFDFQNERIIWKIDYYDRSRTYHSPDAADPKVTVRVLTVMLASEY